jgi:enamine deaminase RidA (YjgF/YER057c/UK114 family)
MLVDISRWQEAARAHGKFFGDVRPASTFVEVSRFIDADWLVEMEADAVVVVGLSKGRQGIQPE